MFKGGTWGVVTKGMTKQDGGPGLGEEIEDRNVKRAVYWF